MKKKKLQLKELKVKSFLTVVNKEEQRTAKGGYVYRHKIAVISHVKDVAGSPSWTSEKTRVLGSDGVLARLSGGGSKSTV